MHLTAISLLALPAVLLLGGCRSVAPETSMAPMLDQAAFAGVDSDASGGLSLRELALYKHREGLAEVDLDNDQRISLQEWKTARPHATDSETAFARIDRDGDGHISDQEAADYITAVPTFRDAFAKMDANHDQALIWEEYAAGDAASLEISLFPAPAALPEKPVP